MAMHDRSRRSSVYQDALKRAKEYIDDPSKLESLLNKAKEKSKDRKGSLKGIKDKLELMYDMVKSYCMGEYREVSSKSLMLTIAAMLYFVIPADLIPDFIFGLGYFDDIAVLAWTITNLREELEAFAAWREKDKANGGASSIRKSAVKAAEMANRSKGDTGELIEGELVDD